MTARAPCSVWACASCAALGTLLAAAACGSSSLGADGGPASGEAISCGPLMYIANGACIHLPPFSDASVAFDDGEDAANDVEATDRGESSADVGVDAGADAGVDAN